MKRINIIIYMLLAGILCSCTDLRTGQIEIKGHGDKDRKISFSATAKTITVDWGDGTVDKISPDGEKKDFSHEYANSDFPTVLIKTKDLTEISFAGSGNIRELRFGKCTALTKLMCSSNQLTSLDVSKCSELTSLWCDSNQLSASALNSLFNSLPTLRNDNGQMAIGENPGANYCNIRIAHRKNGMSFILPRSLGIDVN